MPAMIAMTACSNGPPAAVTDAGPPPPPTCAAGFLGDGGLPTMEINTLGPDGAVTAVAQGDTLPLVFPLQGGFVSFVGVRATNVESCGVQITGALRDLSTQEVRVDSRTINLQPTGDGWGVSGVSAMASAANFSNIPLCPNEWSSMSIYGNVYGLEVTIEDTRGHTLTRKIHVTPQCSQASLLSECLCNCQKGYVLGQACGTQGDP